MFFREGLEGRPAARTSISLIRSAEDRLTYRGYVVGDLSENASFEEVIFLLWFGDLPNRKALTNFSNQLLSSRELPQSLIDALSSGLARAEPMDALRTAVSMLAVDDHEPEDNSEEADFRKASRAIAALPIIAALHSRKRRQLDFVPPDNALGHAENFLYMLNGKRPNSVEARAMNSAMTLQTDHGLDPAALVARITAGTQADLYAALTAAIAAAKGHLASGAMQTVAHTFFALRGENEAREALETMLRSKKKLPGFGSAIYKRADPRAIEFRRVCARLAEVSGNRELFERANHIEEIIEKKTGLSPNADFYCTLAYQTLGLAPEDFAAVFACSRAAGWAAHVAEQHSDTRPIRLQDEYIGLLSRAFVPIDERV